MKNVRHQQILQLTKLKYTEEEVTYLNMSFVRGTQGVRFQFTKTDTAQMTALLVPLSCDYRRCLSGNCTEKTKTKGNGSSNFYRSN